MSKVNRLIAYSKSMLKKKIVISSQIVGQQLKPYPFRILTRYISNFAASILDENDIYYNTEKKLIAHPLFPVRISWEIVEKINQLLESDLPDTLFDHMVHQWEYLEIHRLPNADDELTIQGEFVALHPHKLGAKIVIKFDYFDRQNQLVISEFVAAILFGVKCSDKGNSSIALPTIARIDQVAPIWEETIPISKLASYIYDGCNDIVYPIHTDRKFARARGLSDIILQGTATLAMSISLLIKKELNDDPRRIKVVSAKFTDIVVPPNHISVRLLERNDQNIYFDVTEKAGKFVIKGGYLNIK